MKKKMNNNDIITYGVLVVVFGIILLSYSYFVEKKNKAFEQFNFDLFDSYSIADDPVIEEPIIEEPIVTPNPGDPGDPVEPGVPSDPKPQIIRYDYIGTLEIPAINLKRGFVDVNSKDNTVSKNITVVPPSNYPDVESGNLILAAHSGTSNIAFFRNLYKLSKGDIAYVYYNDVKYIYKIVNIYLQAKTGQIGIYRDYKKTSLTLVTCTKNDSATQTIYIAELISKE